jgi:4-amino-4-deoxy-L-arabinose transferase-like glycosyltransferase
MDAGREGFGSEGGLNDPPAGHGRRVRLVALAEWLRLPGLLALLALWLLFSAGLRPLALPDEGRYASVAHEMLLGDALVPTLNGLPFFHKPPLLYWLDIAAMQAFGIDAFAVRFASLVGAWLMGAALFLALRRWHGEPTARLGLLVIATSPLFFLAGQYANHDKLVGGLITVAVFAFVRAVDEPGAFARRWSVGGWVACALALLAKGLIGVVLPALVVGGWLLAQRRWRDVLRLLHPLGLAAFVLVAAPWLVAMQLRYPGFFDYFIVEQHFRRYAQSNFNNVHPFWFFIVVLPLTTLPWSGWLAVAARRIFVGRHRLLGLYAWWVVAIVGFFSLPSSKLVGYVLPALAPWCALIAIGIGATTVRRRTLAGVACASALIGLSTVAWLTWKAPGSNRAAAQILAARMAPADRVAMVDEYLYDVPFYARLRRPVTIVSDWADPDVPKRDNWRKELFDAARFDPATARATLRPIARLDALACGVPAVWFVVRPDHAAPVRVIGGAVRAYADAHTELWRVPGRADC